VRAKEKAAVRAVEYLKDFSADVIDRFHQGSINGAEAQGLLWDEIQKAVGSIDPRHYDNVLWMRIASDSGDMAEAVGVLMEIALCVISARVVGARAEGDPGVMYAAVEIEALGQAFDLVDALHNAGYNVRDWTYGCHRK